MKKKKDILIPNKNLIKGAIRRLFARSPLCVQVIKEAVHPTIKGKRGGKQFICNICKDTFQQNKVNIDHKESVIPFNVTIQDLDYNTIVDRIFCDKSNLQVLCLNCHKDKTKQERKERKLFKDKRYKDGY